MKQRRKAIESYCEQHSSPASDVLQDLERETHLKTMAPQMISGHLQGRFLSMMSKMIQPERILEIGTFTGYSAICLAEGLVPGGSIHTVEINPEHESIIRKHILAAGLQDKIILHIADALELMPILNLEFDLVFIDASKLAYQRYFDLVFDRTRAGGYILVDNLLWRGKVVKDDDDRGTVALRTFAENIQNDERVENLLLPLRDGLMLCRKK